MARETTKLTVETPERHADFVERLMRERNVLRDEVDRLNQVIKYKDIAINSLIKENEAISDELSKVRNK